MKTKVTLPSKTIKAMAKEQLKGKYWTCVVALLAATIVSKVPSVFIAELTSKAFPNQVAGLISDIITIAMNLGIAEFFLHIFRGLPANFDSFSESFKYVINIFLIELISFFQIFIRLFLLIVPGIICAIKHSMNMFVLADNKDMRPMEVIHKSHELMTGNCWKYVCLNLSFIGWEILANLPSSLYGSYCMSRAGVVSTPIILGTTPQQIYEEYAKLANTIASSTNQLVAFALSLFSVLVMAYVMTAKAAFYDLANGSLAVQTNDDTQGEDIVDLDKEN